MASTDCWFVRPFIRSDVPALLDLMKALAAFEGYVDSFAVTEQDLIEHGLGAAPRFRALVAVPDNRESTQEISGDVSQAGSPRDEIHAHRQTELGGMAVVYEIPWTYDRRPTLVLKELFVAPYARGNGVGHLLMQQVARMAKSTRANKLIWTVLPDNEPAAYFYRSLGGRIDHDWVPWCMHEDALNALASH